MLDTGVKETLCTHCIHRKVCENMLDYLNILKAVENATMKAERHDFISTISVGCKYYKNEANYNSNLR